MSQLIVINVSHGGFGLSEAGELMYKEISGETFDELRTPRDCPWLVEVVENLGRAGWSPYANLKVVEVPDHVAWVIEEFNGREVVAEQHRTWE